MSYFDDASLVFIPSGTKTSKAYSVKPIDGTGDLTFSRSNDTATRVNSAGLIERVRINVLLQSNTFNTTWTASNASVTSGQAGYDGTNNAWLLSKSAASGYISQSPASSGSETISVYAKAGTDNWLHILVRDSASVFFGGYWDLQNGVVGSAIGASTLRIESVGNGWYRCSASFVKSTSNYYRIYPAEGNNDTSGTSGNILIQAAQLETGDIATQPILTTTAAVSVGPVANVPRLDYLNSSCPRLLLEPQRTNVALYSEQFNGSSWTKSGSGVGIAPVVTANDGISPDGYQNADKIDLNLNGGTSSSDWSWVYQSFSATGTQPQAFSIYLKAATAGDVGKVIRVGFISYVTHTLTADWTRVVLNQTFGTTSTFYIGFRLRGTEATANTASLYAWGAQLEQNAAYSSSYIPTLGSASTRAADACSKTGISSLIGQTEGTLFLDAILTHNTVSNEYLIQVRANDDNRFFIYREANTNKLACFARVGAATIYNQVTASAVTGTFKAAFAYKSGSFAFYVNGVQVGTSAATYTLASTLSEFFIDQNNGLEFAYDTYKQALLFKTRLTNAQLAELTSL